jgi:hypothetical protein
MFLKRNFQLVLNYGVQSLHRRPQAWHGFACAKQRWCAGATMFYRSAYLMNMKTDAREMTSQTWLSEHSKVVHAQ